MAIVMGGIRFEAKPRRWVDCCWGVVPMPPKVVVTGVGPEPMTATLVSGDTFADFYRRVWLPVASMGGG